MKKFSILLISFFAHFATAEEVTWSQPVDVVGYSVTESGAPSIEIYYEGATGICGDADSLGKATFVSGSNSAEIQKSLVLDIISAKSSGMDLSFATNEFSVCNDAWGLQIFGIRTEGLIAQ